jgi:hypothetical protein
LIGSIGSAAMLAPPSLICAAIFYFLHRPAGPPIQQPPAAGS